MRTSPLVMRRSGVDPNRGRTWRSIVVSKRPGGRAQIVPRGQPVPGPVGERDLARRGSSHVADTSDASISVRRRSASTRRANVSPWARPSGSR